jgi:hypothetical protein
MKTDCMLFEVRTEFLNIIWIGFALHSDNWNVSNDLPACLYFMTEAKTPIIIKNLYNSTHKSIWQFKSRLLVAIVG